MKQSKSVVSFIVVLAMVLTMCTPVWATTYYTPEGLEYDAEDNSGYSSAANLDAVASISAIATLSALKITSGAHELTINPVFASAGTRIILEGGNLTTSALYNYYSIASVNSTLTISTTGAVSYDVLGDQLGNLVVNAANSTVNAIGTFGSITLANGELIAPNADSVVSYAAINGGTATLKGTVTKVAISGGDTELSGTVSAVTISGGTTTLSGIADTVTVNGGTVYITGTVGALNVSSGSVYIVSGTVDNLTVDGGTVCAVGTLGEVTVNGGNLWIGYTDASEAYANNAPTVVNRGIEANGGDIHVAYTTIDKTDLTMDKYHGIIEISSNAVVTLTEGAVVYRNENTTAGTIVGVLNHSGTLNINGGEIQLKASGTFVNDVTLIGIESYYVVNISSGSVTLTNGQYGENVGILNNQGTLVLGSRDGVKDSIAINVACGGYGIKTLNDGASTTIYDADITVSEVENYGGYGIHADGTSTLMILAGLETVAETAPAGTVFVNAAGGTALYVGANVNWAIAGGYKTSVFEGITALNAKSSLTPSAIEAVYESGKPLTAGYFVGSVEGKAISTLIPSTNYYVDDTTVSGEYVVIDLTWEAQNALQAANGNVEATKHTVIDGSTVTYTLEQNITYGAVTDTLHGRVETTTVALRSGRNLVKNSFNIYDIGSTSSSALLSDATYYYASDDNNVLAHTEFNEDFGSGAYVRFSSAPSDAAIKGVFNNLVSKANSHASAIAEIAVFNRTHYLATTPSTSAQDQRIYVSPSAASAAASLNITGSGTYYVVGNGDYAASAAALVVNHNSANVTASGIFNSVDVDACTSVALSSVTAGTLTVDNGTVYIDGGTYETVNVNGGTVYISNNAYIGELNIAGGAVYEYASTMGTVRVTDAALWLGYESEGNSSDAAGSAVTGGISASGSSAKVYVYNTSLASAPVAAENYSTSVVQIYNGAEVYLASGAAIYKNNNISESTSGNMYGVYNHGGKLYMATGSSISLKRDTATTTLNIIGILNDVDNSCAYISGASISLTNGTDASTGIYNNGTLVLGNKDGVKDDLSIKLNTGGYGIYTYNSGAKTTIYDADIEITGNSDVNAYGIYSTNSTALTIEAGDVTVDSGVPTSTVAITIDPAKISAGCALYVGSGVTWSIAGGYQTAVFTAVKALETQTNASNPTLFTAGRYVGTITGAKTSLGDLVPATNYAINGTVNVDQTVVDLTWQLKNAMEQSSPVEFTSIIYPSSTTTDLYTGTTETLVGDVDYQLVVTNPYHGHIANSSVAAMNSRSLNLNNKTVTGEDSVDLFYVTEALNISGAGVIEASTANAINLSGAALNISDHAEIKSLTSGHAIDMADGTLNVTSSTLSAISGDAIEMTKGTTVITSSVLSTAKGEAIDMEDGSLTITSSSAISSVAGDAVNMTTGTAVITSSTLSAISGDAIEMTTGTAVITSSALSSRFDDAVHMIDGVLSISSSVISAEDALAAIDIDKGQLDLTASTVSAVTGHAVGLYNGVTAVISGSAISTQNGDSFYMVSGTASAIATDFSTQNGDAVYLWNGCLTIYSGTATTVSGDAIRKNGGTLNVSGGSFRSAEGFGLEIAGGNLNTMLYGGTFSSVKNGAADYTSLAAMVPYENEVPAYTFKTGNATTNGVYLSHFDLLFRSNIVSGSAANAFTVNIASGEALESDFEVVPRVYYDIYYTSDDHTTVSAVQGEVTYGSTDTDTTFGALTDIQVIHFKATGGALTLAFESEDDYLLKEIALATIPGFYSNGRIFVYENHYGNVNSTQASVNDVSSMLNCDYALKAVSSEKAVITVTRDAIYAHGAASYEYLFDAAGTTVTKYAISAPASADLFTTADAITSASIDIAAGNKLQLTFTPDSGHSIHSFVTDIAPFNVISGGVEAATGTPYNAWAAVATDSSIAVEFCDKTSPAALTPSAVSYAAVSVQKGSTWTLTAPVSEAADAHYQLAATAGAWTVDEPAYVTLGAVSGASITLSAIADITTPVAVTFTPAVTDGGAASPASVTWYYTVSTASAPTGGGGGGGGSAAASYDVTVNAEGVTSDKKSAVAGDTITITVPAGSTDVKVTDAKGNEIALTKISDTKYSFKMPSSKVNVSYASESPKAGFVDVDENDYYYDAVNWAVANGITTGTDAEHFSPDAVTDRAQAVTFLWRAAGCPEPTTTDNPFTDIDSGKYYYKAVLWAVEQGITNGIAPGQFGPEAYLTRAHIVTFLYRFAKPSGSFSNNFVDLRDGDFYVDAVSWANENGIAAGLDATHFGPDDLSVRANTVTFLYRFFK